MGHEAQAHGTRRNSPVQWACRPPGVRTGKPGAYAGVRRYAGSNDPGDEPANRARMARRLPPFPWTSRRAAPVRRAGPSTTPKFSNPRGLIPMRRVLSGALMVGLGLGLAGCGETSKVENEKTIETPGGTTKIKETQSINQKGENPPST